MNEQEHTMLLEALGPFYIAVYKLVVDGCSTARTIADNLERYGVPNRNDGITTELNRLASHGIIRSVGKMIRGDLPGQWNKNGAAPALWEAVPLDRVEEAVDEWLRKQREKREQEIKDRKAGKSKRRTAAKRERELKVKEREGGDLGTWYGTRNRIMSIGQVIRIQLPRQINRPYIPLDELADVMEELLDLQDVIEEAVAALAIRADTEDIQAKIRKMTENLSGRTEEEKATARRLVARLRSRLEEVA